MPKYHVADVADIHEARRRAVITMLHRRHGSAKLIRNVYGCPGRLASAHRGCFWTSSPMRTRCPASQICPGLRRAEPVEILAAQVGQTSGDADRPGPSAMLYYGRS